MSAYVPPDLETLRDSISRDLHDPNNSVFTTPEVVDLINSGIAEVNRLIPKEYRGTIPLVSSQFEYPLDATVEAVFAVEWWKQNADDVMVFSRLIPHRDGYSTTGWQFFGGSLLLPTNMNITTDANDSLVVMGYQDRDPLIDDEDIFDGDLQDEMVLRAYCAHSSFERLIASRALFQQWQTQANNSDVSATQLIGMAATYSSEWRQLRQRVRRLRRVD